MRLRTNRTLRSRRPSPPDGLTARPGTPIGNLDSDRRARVDPSGRLTIDGAGWALECWIGAEDRWHLPGQEAAVRQQLLGSSPVVETRVRIPSGDAVVHAYGARGPRGEDLVVVEVHNDSKVPVALALAVQPCPGGIVSELGLDGPALRIDGAAVLHLARSPGRIALSTAVDERPAGEVVRAGDAEPVRSHTVRCRAGGAEAVLLFPLAHTARFRVAISPDGSAAPVDPGELPSAAQVASGWATHSRGGARIEVPDRRLREAIAAATRGLLLDGEGPRVARALGRLGFPDEASRRAGSGADRAGTGDVLAERAERWRLHRHLLVDDEAPWLAGAVERWARDEGDAAQEALGRAALPGLAELLEGSGEARAAADVRDLAIERAPASATLADLHELVGRAGPTFTWAPSGGAPDRAEAARFLLAVVDHLVDDRGDELVLSPAVPDAWLGQGWEVHDLPTAAGPLSYAIRWHGDRPALLWELEPHGDTPVARLRCGLDPTWSSTEPVGEALLAAVPVPARPVGRRGLTIPVTIEPARRPL